MNTNRSALDPRLWLLISPALPVGGYSYSHGLESAVLTGRVSDFESAREFIGSLAERVLPRLDLPLLHRLLEALHAGNTEQLNYWNDIVHATRESSELLLEDKDKGRALQRLFPAIGLPTETYVDEPSFPAAFAQVCYHWNIPSATAMCGYAWSWFEMLVAAVVKLVPLGHSDGQRMLLEFNENLNRLAACALEYSDEEIGAGAPGLAMLSSGHETQYARQFRS